LAMIEEIAASSNSNQLAPVSASLVEGLLPTSTNL
jgi:hypothetical protein